MTDRDNTDVLSGWGDRLLAARTAANLSRRELAERIGVSAKSIQRWEASNREPTAAQQARLELALGVRVSDLLPRTEREAVLEGIAAEYDDLLERVGGGCS